MSAKESSLEEKLVEISQRPGREHLVTIIKAGIAAIPFVGGSLITLIDEYYPNWQIERIKSFLTEVAIRLEELEQYQIKAEYIETEEFGYLFVETLRAVSREHQREKIEAYGAILLNSLITPDFPPSESEFFLALVQELSVPHIQMLRVLARPQEAMADDLKFEKRVDGNWLEITIRGVLHRVFTGGPEGYVDAIWAGLQARGIVVEATYRQTRRYSAQAELGTTYDYTKRVLDDLPQALTPFGRRFVQFIMEPPVDAEAEGQD